LETKIHLSDIATMPPLKDIRQALVRRSALLAVMAYLQKGLLKNQMFLNRPAAFLYGTRRGADLV